MKIQLFCVILLLSISCYGQSYSLLDFEECSIPKRDSPDWYKLNHATDKEFYVIVDSGKLVISKSYGNESVEYSLSNGKLIGIDMGEFGGGLYFKPIDSNLTKIFVNGKDGSKIQPDFLGGLMVPHSNPVNQKIKNFFLLKSGNVSSVLSFNDSVYFLGGMQNLGLGAAFKLSNENDSFFISKKVDFYDAPLAAATSDHFIYIATENSFCILDQYLNKKLLFENLFWHGLYPNSVAVLDDRNIYVGMRGGYVKINIPKMELKLYKVK
jgi:hypothetical protein